MVKATEHEIVILAMAAGADLLAIKDDVGHGKFGSWLKANVACRPAHCKQVYGSWPTAGSVIAANWNRFQFEHPARALRLLITKKKTSRSKPKATDESTEEPPPPPTITVDAVIAWLKTAEPADRARVIAVLPQLETAKAHQKAEDAKAAAAQAHQKAEDAKAIAASETRYIEKIEATVATSASATVQIRNIEDILKHRRKTKNAKPRFTPESRMRFAPSAPSTEAIAKQFEADKAALAVTTTTEPPDVSAADPEDTRTRHLNS